MDLFNSFLDFVVPPASLVMLAFAWPTLCFVNTCEWIYNTYFQSSDMEGKVVIITGASSGVGEQIAYEYAKRRATLVLIARRDFRLRGIGENARLFGANNVLIIAADVVKEEDCRRFVNETVRIYGRGTSYYGWSTLMKLLILLHCLALTCVLSKEFDFYYFVQQWPASYCDTKKSCCYPITGKPQEDFGIHGLWPNNNDGSYPTDCDSNNSFDFTQVVDLTSSLQENWPTLACPSAFGLKFWGHEWDKHGTCCESVLDQHSYFAYALQLKDKAKTLQSLTAAGVTPTDGKYYTLQEIKGAIKEATGFTPWIDCNKDVLGNHQLYQVYMCVDKTGLGFIECPVFPHGRSCGSAIAFPSFSSPSFDVL